VARTFWMEYAFHAAQQRDVAVWGLAGVPADPAGDTLDAIVERLADSFSLKS
jgi:hypothetical protein